MVNYEKQESFYCSLLSSSCAALHKSIIMTLRSTNLQAALAVLNPPFCSKVGGLCTVEAMVVARVVAVGESDHDLSRLLGDLHTSHTLSSIHKPAYYFNLQAKR
jgi:hypothetical protein